jgi:DNA-damage-inducible protein J
MATVQVATRVDQEQNRKFRATTKKLGTTPADALRMFIAAFNAEGGFPYQPKLKAPVVEAFDNEEDAADFASHLAQRMIHETR